MDGTYSMMVTIIVIVADRCLSWWVVWIMAASCGVSSVEKGYGGLLTCWRHPLLSNSQPSSFIAVVVAAVDGVDGSDVRDTSRGYC